MRDGQWKLFMPVRRNGGEVELFDLATDISESNNVAKNHPDVVARLSKSLTAWVAELPEQYQKSDDSQRKREE